MADDLGIGELQWYPEEADISSRTASVTDTFQTPALFQLAREGLRFTNYHSPAPVCSPARAAILTGRYPQELNIRDALADSTGRGLPSGTVTIASLLRDQAGYQTGHFGKWHLGNAYPEYFPVHFGFDESLTRFGNDLYAGYKGSTFVEGDALATRAVVDPQEHSATTITSRAIQFIEAANSSGTPYFLNVWYRAPHFLIDPPGNFPKSVIGSWQPKTYSNWPVTWSELVQSVPELQGMAYLEDHSPTADAKQRAMYIAQVAWLDYQIGRLIKRIDELDPDGNTLIVFVSDNGAQVKGFAAGNGAVPGTWSPNGELVGYKGATLEGGIRAPFIVRWPAASLAAGQLSDELTSGYDFLPTLLEAAGLAANSADYAGVSILNRILGQGPVQRSAPAIWENRYVGGFWAGTDINTTLDEEQNSYAVWDGSLARKLVVFRDQFAPQPLYSGIFGTSVTNASGVEEIPGANLIQQEPAAAIQLEDQYRRWREQVGQIPHAYNLDISTADINESCLEFSGSSELVELEPNARFDILEGDFGFQVRLEPDTIPLQPGKVVAQHPGSWSLTVEPGSSANQLGVTLEITAKNNVAYDYPGTPGDTVVLSGEALCAGDCSVNIAFTILGLASAESSVRLYLDGAPVDEYRGDANDSLAFREVYKNGTSRVLIGNNAAGNAGFGGKIIDPRFFTMNLTNAEITAILNSQAAQECDAGCH